MDDHSATWRVYASFTHCLNGFGLRGRRMQVVLKGSKHADEKDMPVIPQEQQTNAEAILILGMVILILSTAISVLNCIMDRKRRTVLPPL